MRGSITRATDVLTYASRKSRKAYRDKMVAKYGADWVLKCTLKEANSMPKKVSVKEVR